MLTPFAGLSEFAHARIASVSTYEGFIASRGRMPTTPNADAYSMGRSAHFASQDITSLKLIIPNFYNNGFLGAGSGPIADTGPGASADVTASIEYPAGVFTQVKFSGSATGTIADGSYIVSDSTTISIPDATQFWVRIWRNCAAGGVYAYPIYNQSLGDRLTISATPIADQTLSVTVPDDDPFTFPPIAIIGQTTKPSVAIIGNSIGAGFADSETSNIPAWNGKRGIIARSLASIPFVNLSVSGEAATSFLSNGTQRKLLMQYASAVVSDLGTNDLNGGQTSAATIAALESIFALVPPGRQTFQTTITPLTTSTDSWATLINQTNTEEAAVATFNIAVRAGLAGVTGFFDVRPVVESVPASGLWVVNGTAFAFTGDGLHPSVAGYALIPPSNAINPAVFTWP